MISERPSAWEFLIVCDDARLRETLTTSIQQFGGDTNWTSDATAALAYISRRKLDGIFIDMRVEGGLRLVGSIRRGSSNRYAVIFACTAEHEEATHLLNSGVNFVVQKMLDVGKVTAILESATQMMLLERQRYLRHRLTVPVTLKTSGKEHRAITANISRGGMAVRCRDSLEPGSAINFMLDLPGGSPVHGQGEVAWAKVDGNMGIRFYLLGDNIKRTLWNWMEQQGQNPA